MKINNDIIVDFFIKNNATLEQIIEVRKYLDRLLKDAEKFYALEVFGVDNWDSYAEAISEYYNNKEEE